ncbi:lipocalin family protein [Hyphobacterium sp. HN65]|uniref:Outer membrane lipoprotein Blc n=1 Tax=Hyphobacterium lacteum TaxID=3116575 RepID=A0ABU7LRA0_9PROT|nr:lipocalin family protein [Hyphobacterium sp. HN65]MEE2526410.1 lipocalin family protein [Hyphobacterium sp. HN65]
MRLKPFALVSLCLALAACSSPRDRLAGDEPPPVADNVDIERYLGTWFEIARADHSFERNCDGVSAFYERREDGAIRVINRCWKGGLDGELEVAEGRALIADRNSNARLRVSFFGPFFGDYWILDVAEDYSWAVISEPAGRYLWILAREPQMDPALLQERLDFLQGLGFDTDGLIYPDQWESAAAAPTDGLPG